jgi:peptide/nickel transport system permease protein
VTGSAPIAVKNSSGADVDVDVDVDDKDRSPTLRAAVLSSWAGRIGLALSALMLAIIFIGPFLASYDPAALGVSGPLMLPTSEHPFGTDNLGRDVLSRFLNGGQTVLLVPLAAVAVTLPLGALPGMAAGFIGGRFDLTVTRLFDLMLSLPPLLVVLMVINGVGSSSLVLVLTVGLIFAPRVGRIARGATQAVMTNDYVHAAQARGEHTLYILLREILPNIAGPMIADLALRVTYAVIFVSTLNFLGLGAQPPSPDWGLTIASALELLPVQPWAALAPVIGIASLSIAFNLVADSLARYFSPESSAEAFV